MNQIISAKKLMLAIFFQPYSLGVIDILPQNKVFTTEYFIQHVIAPLHQLYFSASLDNARRKQWFHFNNSMYHTAGVAMEEMDRLNCIMVPHPPYSHDFAICDFYFFGHYKGQLAGMHVESLKGLVDEVSEILKAIPKQEKVKAFNHWIELCECVAEHHGNYYNPSQSIGRLILIECLIERSMGIFLGYPII
jgi:hypothetical protein